MTNRIFCLGAMAKPIVLDNPVVSGVSYLHQWSDSDNGFSYNFSTMWNKIHADGDHPFALTLWCNSDLVETSCTKLGYGLTGSKNCSVPAYVWEKLGEHNYTTSTTGQRMPNYLNVNWKQPLKHWLSAVMKEFGPYAEYIRICLGHGGEAIPIQHWDDLSTPLGKAYARWGMNMSSWQKYILGIIDYCANLPTKAPKMMPISPMGNPDETLSTFIAQNSSRQGIGFGYQGLDSSDTVNTSDTVANWYGLFQDYVSSGVLLELQTMWFSCPTGNNCVSKQGQTGPLPPLLDCAKASGCNVVELYQQDLDIALDPNNPNNPTYGQSYYDAMVRYIS